MSVIDDLTPKHYKKSKLIFFWDDAGVLQAYATLRILNAGGGDLRTTTPELTLSEAERIAIENNIAARLVQFETATGLTEWQAAG